MMLSDLPHVDLAAVTYDEPTLAQPTGRKPAIERRSIFAGSSACARIVLVPELRCVVLVLREQPCVLVPLERCWFALEARAQ